MGSSMPTAAPRASPIERLSDEIGDCIEAGRLAVYDHQGFVPRRFGISG